MESVDEFKHEFRIKKKHFQRWYGFQYFILSILEILGSLIGRVLDYGLRKAKIRREVINATH